MPIHVEIVTREGLVFACHSADMVLLPASEGQIGVLPHHAPIVTSLGYGELVVKKGNSRESFAIFGGFAEVHPGRVIVLAELAESTYDIDIERAEAARAHAQKLIQDGVPEIERRAALLELRRATVELRLCRRMKNRAIDMRIPPEDCQED